MNEDSSLIKHSFIVKNEKSVQSTTENLQKAIDKIKREDNEPSQKLLCKYSNVSRSNLRHYRWAIDEISRLKKQWKEDRNNEKQLENIIKFESIESRLKSENNNFRIQNSEYFQEILNLQQKVSKLQDENQLILKQRDEYKTENTNLRLELKNYKLNQTLKVRNLREE